MHRALNLLGAFLFGEIAIAAPLFSTASGPTSQPVEETILVLTFATPDRAGDAWLGKAVQQDLFTDLAQGTRARLLAPATLPPATDADSARQAGQRAGASVVVFGLVQAAGTEMRITGQVIDVTTSRPLANLKATGPANSLFHLEDAIAGQTFAAIPRSLLNAQALQPQHPQASQNEAGTYTASTQQGTSGVPTTSSDGSYAAGPSYVSPSTTTYSYTYCQPVPVYTYPYPAFDLFPFTSTFVFIDVDHFHPHFGHDFDHDGDIDDFRRGRFHNLGNIHGRNPMTPINQATARTRPIPGPALSRSARPRFAPAAFGAAGTMQSGFAPRPMAAAPAAGFGGMVGSHTSGGGRR